MSPNLAQNWVRCYLDNGGWKVAVWWKREDEGVTQREKGKGRKEILGERE